MIVNRLWFLLYCSVIGVFKEDEPSSYNAWSQPSKSKFISSSRNCDLIKMFSWYENTTVIVIDINYCILPYELSQSFKIGKRERK